MLGKGTKDDGFLSPPILIRAEGIEWRCPRQESPSSAIDATLPSSLFLVLLPVLPPVLFR